MKTKSSAAGEGTEPGVLDLRCHQNPRFLLILALPSPVIPTLWREVLALVCTKAFAPSPVRPSSSRVPFSIAPALCHGLALLSIWLPPPTASGSGLAPAGVHEVLWCSGPVASPQTRAGLSPPVGAGRSGGSPSPSPCPWMRRGRL